MYRQKSTFLLYFCLCFFPVCEAGMLAERINELLQGHQNWSSTIKHMQNIERHSMRNISLEASPTLEYMRQRVRNSSVEEESRAVFGDKLYPPYSDWSPEHIFSSKSDLNGFNNILKQLPTVDFDAYAPLVLHNSAWQRFSIGSIYHEDGLMHGSVALTVAKQRIDRLRFHPDYQKIILSIRSRSGRLVEHLYQNQEGDVLWPQDSIFRCVDKDISSDGTTGYLDLQEISMSDDLDTNTLLHSGGSYTCFY